jgi:tripartite ATP-independent transporter DctP family solute receptor
MKKTVCVVFALLFVICTLFLPTYAFGALKSEYKMSCNVTENTTWGQAVVYFIDLVKKGTDGNVNIKPYWQGVLLGGKQTMEFQLIRNGTIDFSIAGLNNFASQIPACDLMNLPFFLSSEPNKYKALDAIKRGKSGKMIEDILAKHGIVTLAWTESGFRELHLAKKDVVTPTDIKGLKIRFVASPLQSDIFHILGANPVSINWNEAISAYQQGMVDGGENPLQVIIPYKIQEFHKHMIQWGYTMAGLNFVAGQKSWDTFDEKTQKVILAAAKEAALYHDALIRMGLDDGWAYKYLKDKNMLPKDQETMPHDPIAFLRSKGVKYTILTPEQIEAFRKQCQPVYDEWIPKVGKDIYEAALEDIKSVRGQ